MKLTFRYFALAVVGALMSGCAEEVEVVQPAVNGTVTMKTTISLDGKSATRALTEGGVKTFAAGDQIAVIYEQGTGTGKAVSVALTAADIDASDAHKATFSVALTNPKANGKVRYIYPAAMAADDVSATTPDAATINYTALNTQDGTLTSLASTYDLAVYDGMMSTTATLPTGTGVELKNQLSIVKLATITDGTNDMRANITDLTIDDGTNTYIISRTAEDAPIFVAMLPTNGDITFSTVIGGFPYTKTATGKTLAKNKIYPINLAMVQDMRATPLTFEAIEAGTIHVTFKEGLILPNPITYTKNGEDCEGGTTNFDIPVVAGDIISFHSTNAVLAQLVGYEYKYMNIHPTNRCYIYGNVMSLIDDQGDFAADKVIGGDLAFEGLFNQADKLENHPTKELLLPATTLTYNCYSMMFANCKALTKAPNLPAAELKESCYYNMFKGCVGLTEGPIMSATTLASLCCYGMFNNCTNLVKAPDLLATTLAPCCYQMMFSGCSSLNYVKCLAMDIGDANIYSLDNWLNNVSATGTLVVSSGATWAEAGTNGIPAGWTVTSE